MYTNASRLSVSVMIPVWNERAALEKLLSAVIAASSSDKQIVIVDDGSTDGTGERMRAIVSGCCGRNDRPPVVLRHEKRRGKGAAIRTAIPYCRGEVTIIQDADFEYDPSEYPRLMRPILDGRAEVVYGSRFRGSIEGMRWPNRIVNHVLTWLANALYDANITDEATCYKAFRTTLLQSLPLRCKRFEFCPEVTALIRKRGIRIHEVPISYKARTRAEGKKIRWYDFFEAVWTLVKYRFIHEPKASLARPANVEPAKPVVRPVG